MTRTDRTEVLRQSCLDRIASTATCVLLLCSAMVGTAADAQSAKLSEADLRKELTSAGRPLVVHAAPPQEKIADRYIVLFDSSVTDPSQEARDIASATGGTLHHTYAHAVKGFSATLSPGAIEALRHDSRVVWIEEDRRVHAAALLLPQSPQQPAPSWALDRIDQRGPILDSSFAFPTSAGSGVHMYIVDTGVLGGIFGAAGAHVELDGRIGDGVDFVTPSTQGNDCAGHGTLPARPLGWLSVRRCTRFVYLIAGKAVVRPRSSQALIG